MDQISALIAVANALRDISHNYSFSTSIKKAVGL